VQKQGLIESCEERCEKLEAAFRMVMVYSHEITDHLTVIMGKSDLIHDFLGAHSPVKKHMDEIVRSARRAGVASSKIASLKEHFVHRE
jgi:tRNA A37 methylthiotransferase MiaB